MNCITKLFQKEAAAEAEATKGSVEEFVSLVRVYYQAIMAMNLGITNLNILPDLKLFKQMLKVPTQNNKLGAAEKARVKKVLMQDYGLGESFFHEMDASVKRSCKKPQDIQSYFIQFQGFSQELFNLMGGLMSLKFRFAILFKKLLYGQTVKTVHEIMTRSEWKDVSVQKAAWSVRTYANRLGYSEQWITDFVYNVVLLAREDQKREAKEKRKKKA